MGGLENVSGLISWLPTTVFILIILISMLSGFMRGYRKSMIFLIHSFVAACICLALYFLFKDNAKIDELLLTVTNFILGSETGLQDMLNVSADCSSIKEVLLEYIPANMNFIDGLSLILKDNGAYILTLIDLAYSLIFAIIFYCLYLILIGILAIMYHLFYSDRKYRKKDAKKIMKGLREHRYSRRRALGTTIGLFRGFISAFIYISFVGTVFFIASGGDGTKQNQEFDFGNENINNVYNAYNTVCNYGNEGIFKLFNTFKDNDNTPYYLFAADIVLSGELRINEEYTDNIIFREELATYVDFSRDTINLLLKHGGDEIKKIFNSDEPPANVEDVLIPIMLKEEFQAEFELLISNFDSKVYFSGLALSLIDSIVSNIDEIQFTSSIDSQIKDLLCIIFKKGYLSESIPYEKALKVKLSNTKNPNLEEYNLGHISASDIVNKDNMLCAYKILNYILAYTYELGNDATDEDMLQLIENIIPYIDNLSIFYPENSDKLDKLYRRLYAYVQYNFMEEEKEELVVDQLSTKYYISEEYSSIDWVYELNSLVDSASDIIYMYKKIDIDFEDSDAIIDLIFSIYNPNDPNYSEFSVKMDKVIAYLLSSRLLPEVLASNFIYSTIEEGLSSAFEDYQMPNLKYANTYNKYGTIVEFGEVYHLLTAIKALALNQDNYTFVKDLMNLEINEDEIFDLINDVCSHLTSENNKLAVDSLLSSKLMRSILSTLLYTIELDGNSLIYADKTILEAEGTNPTNIIVKSELANVIYLLPELLELVKPLLEGDFTNEQLADLLADETLVKMLDSTLIEGTISNIVVTFIKDVKEIIIPQSILNGEGYISTSGKDSEIKNIINVVKDLSLDLAGLMEGNVEDSVDDLLNNDNLGRLFDSKILHYTLSYYITTALDDLLTGFMVIIPDSTKDVLVNDTVDSIIKRDEFLEFLDIARDLMPGDNEEALDANGIIKKVIGRKDKYLSNIIISATIINYLANDADLDDYLAIPARFKSLASREMLETRYDKTSIWYDELFKLCTGLDEFFNISAGESFDLNNVETITDSVSDLLEDPTIKSNVDKERIKLDVIYDSVIVAKTLSNELNKYLTDDLLSPDIKYSKYVYEPLDGYYLKEEIVKLAHAISVLGLSLDTGFDNSILSIPTEPTDKQKVYDSLLVFGLISNIVDDVLDSAGDTVRRMDLAYNQNYINEFKIFKQTEIDVFIDLLGDDLNSIISGDLSFTIADFTLTEFKNIMFDENNEIKSYILTGTMSDTIINSGYFYIPKEDYDYDLEIISVESLITLIDSLVAANFDTLDVDLNNFEFPSDDIVPKIAESRILRATLSKKIDITSQTNDIIVGVTHDKDINGNLLYFNETVDYQNNKLSYLTKDEFTNLICAITALLGDDKAFEFNMDIGIIHTIIALNTNIEKRNEILQSSVIRCALNDLFVQGFSYEFDFGGYTLSISINYDFFEEKIDNFGTVDEDLIRNLKTENDITVRLATYEQFVKIFDYFN